MDKIKNNSVYLAVNVKVFETIAYNISDHTALSGRKGVLSMGDGMRREGKGGGMSLLFWQPCRNMEINC